MRTLDLRIEEIVGLKRYSSGNRGTRLGRKGLHKLESIGSETKMREEVQLFITELLTRCWILYKAA